MTDYADDLRTTVTRAADRLAALPDADAARQPSPGKWCVKEIIGHLVDSAANNHARFVRAQAQDDLVFQGYQQAEWVDLQHYREAPWPDLVRLWRDYNLHIARIIDVMPAEARLRERHRHNLDQIAWKPVAGESSCTLDYFMRDYVGHLHHHLGQVEAILGWRLDQERGDQETRRQETEAGS
jgi:hypothetical protein